PPRPVLSSPATAPPACTTARRAPPRTVGLVAGAAALLVFPRAVPVLASALAGLVAIGALARLALIRIVLALPGDEPAALPAEARAAPTRPPLSRR
ncbi:hypothetical protein FV230_29175, partial [Methylobacterium sp. WL6]